MEEHTERYFAITVFGYDKATNNPMSILIPFTVKFGRYVNNRTLINMAQKVHPSAILLHVSNIQEFTHPDDLLDYIAQPPEQNVTMNPEDKGKLIRDGDPEPFFYMSQSLTPMQNLPFFDHYGQEVCRYCKKEEIDPDHFPYCGEICEIKAKSEE